ncbi:MAG: outer membrane protein assembly factor BamE [Pseudomonadales bacterium]|nr:outer membrane protein assembly factor BamE [Pseudomonadales bacterium]
MIRITVVFLLVAALTACSTFRFPGVHRITIQQGNVVTQQMVDRLKPAMTKSQVTFVLGNPVIDDPLEANRWDYVYSIQLPNGNVIRKVLSVFFIDERLSYFMGDFIPTDEYDALAKTANRS